MKLKTKNTGYIENFERVMDAKLILSIVATAIMSFTGIVVETSMNVAFPVLMEEFGITTSTVQWMTTGYLLILSIVIPTSSYLKRRFPMKTLFLTAGLLFIIGTLFCGFAPIFPLLLTGRLIQGVGAGIAIPLMLNIVIEQAPYDKMGFMMGVAILVISFSPVLGPTLGGIMVSNFSWRAIFYILLPLLVISLVFGVWALRQTRPTQKVRFRFGEWLMLALGFTMAILATSYMSVFGATSPIILGCFVACAVFMILFFVVSRRSEDPLIHTKILRMPSFACGVLAIFLQQILCLSQAFALPNFTQLGLGKGAMTAGMVLMVPALVSAAFSPFAGKLLDK